MRNCCRSTSASHSSSTRAASHSSIVATAHVVKCWPATLAHVSSCCSASLASRSCISSICFSVSGTPGSTCSSGTVTRQRPPPPAAVPPLRRLHEHAALREVIDHRGHEQRIAVGVPVDQRGESRRKLAGRESGRDIRRHVGFLQPFEHHFMTQTVQQQILLQRFQRTVGEDQFRRPQRAEHEQARGLAPPRDRRNHVQRRVIDPVQIFEDQHQRHGLRDHFERFAQLAHHAFPRRAENLALQRRLLFRPHQRRKLDQPGRRVCRQCVDDERAERTAGELTDRFEQRIVRLLAAEALDRLPARHRHGHAVHARR